MNGLELYCRFKLPRWFCACAPVDRLDFIERAFEVNDTANCRKTSFYSSTTLPATRTGEGWRSLCVDRVHSEQVELTEESTAQCGTYPLCLLALTPRRRRNLERTHRKLSEINVANY